MTSGAFLWEVSFAEFASYNAFMSKFISNYEGELCYYLSRTTVNHEVSRLQSAVLEITLLPSEYTSLWLHHRCNARNQSNREKEDGVSVEIAIFNRLNTSDSSLKMGVLVLVLVRSIEKSNEN